MMSCQVMQCDVLSGDAMQCHMISVVMRFQVMSGDAM